MTSIRLPYFDIVRLLAAIIVVFSHSFLIATGTEEGEPLYATGHVSGVYGVFIFFIISGFLVTESAKRSASVADYFRKRFLRIAPAFAVSTLVVVYLVCPFFVQAGAMRFITSPEVLSTTMQVIFLHVDNLYFTDVQFYTPANGPDWLPHLASGVLWTIRLEIIGYLLIAILMALGLLRSGKQVLTLPIVAVLAGCCVVYLHSFTKLWLGGPLLVLPSLCCGIGMNWLVQYHRLRAWIAVIFAIGVIPAAYFHVLPETFCFFAAYPIIWVGINGIPMLRFTGNGTDISYGIYLYGWPMLQLLRAALGPNLNGYEMAVLAIPATAAVAYLSWYFVEKPALSFKRPYNGFAPAVMSDSPAKQQPPGSVQIQDSQIT